MGKRVALHNLGCKVNAYELDRIAGSLQARGFEIVPFDETADIYIVNTCTVTNIADRKSRQMLHRAKKHNPDAVVALGCYVDTDAESVKKEPCIDIALGNKDKAGLAKVLDTYPEVGQNEVTDGPSCTGGITGVQASDYHSRTRAYIKIQDGCNLFCSYCIIPYARGRSVSRAQEDVLREAEALAAQGMREVVLTGIHLSSYPDLTELILRLNEITGMERIRLGSLEPRMITQETVHALRGADKLCPHFHLSLQSGCDAVLQRMRRRYTTAEFAESAALLREAYDHPAITTDIITGFPGETEAEFEESRAFIDRMNFYETHVFPFSARKGTAAAKMEGQLTQKEKAARADVLIRMSAEKAKAYRAQFLDKTVRVLWEETEAVAGKLFLTGHTERYVKVAQALEQRDGRAQSETGAHTQAGNITDVQVTSFLTDTVLLA